MINPQNWRAASMKEVLDHVQFLCESKNRKPPVRYAYRDEIKPVDLYVYLKARFGDPNGFQMALRKDDSDNLIHWNYTVYDESLMIDIISMNHRTEIIIFGDFVDSAGSKMDLLDSIKRDFPNHAKEMGNARKTLEKWIVFRNPFYKLQALLDIKEQKITDFVPIISEQLEMKYDPSNPEIFQQKMQSYCKNIYDYTGNAMLIRMILPVYIESFLNLILALFCRPDIKKNQRLYEKVVRENIDIKIQSLHINCLGFSKAVNYGSEVLGKYHTIVNSRNDLLHGNVDPEKQKIDIVFFEGKIPLFSNIHKTIKDAVASDLQGCEPTMVLEEVTTCKSVIKEIKGCLEKDFEELLSRMMTCSTPGYCQEKMRFGILFPEHFVDFGTPEMMGGA